MSPNRILEAVRSDASSIMSPAYAAEWNSEVQGQIDRDIDAWRKADACIHLPKASPGTEVQVQQTSHSFVFGAHLFNFDQLGSDAANARYKDLFGTLFNSATIPFYWKTFEPEEGKPRFEAGYRDSAAFWNSRTEPDTEPHWRRPATDPLVDFCEQKGIRCHGHTFVWGNARWHMPDWILAKLPQEYHQQLALHAPGLRPTAMPVPTAFQDWSAEQIESALPQFTTEIHTQMARRIFEIALRYKGRIQSWDIVNESASDAGRGVMIDGSGLCKSEYGLMPGDYAYRAFKLAESVLPQRALLNINDYNLSESYLQQVLDLKNRGCRIDVMGAQMHLFNPQFSMDIAEGKPPQAVTVEYIRKTMDCLSQAGIPIHLSEITIPTPGDDERSLLIQAIIARNLYRLWFSQKNMMGITWWNVVDGCGAPGEPSVSGMFTRDMQTKPVYHILNDLLHREWKTSLNTRTDSDRTLRFRGFRGRYQLSWQDADGVAQSVAMQLD